MKKASTITHPSDAISDQHMNAALLAKVAGCAGTKGVVTDKDGAIALVSGRHACVAFGDGRLWVLDEAAVPIA
ncbi:MAG: hypothetical protein EI684_23265 [Candidatus Viridilinea halotolerans]|uniref:Uncharacterized protein n=1 Tax=Candidatus Viridilinea halotolerans TaxID=2491704 RepID=A0A426TQA7_9CHLR|nr:MAG: hypothetical protein EI684_23265 [Candidatus Viridilinea halotolerans]